MAKARAKRNTTVPGKGQRNTGSARTAAQKMASNKRRKR